MREWRERGNDYRDWEWELTCKDGSKRTISWSNISARFPIPGWTSWRFGVDGTQRKRAEDLARKRQTELARVSRLSLIGGMASAIAHELNQPLSAILNYARGCVRRWGSQEPTIPEAVNMIENIAAQAERAGAVLNRIRSFVQHGEPQLASTDMNGLVDEASKLTEIEARENGVRIDLQLGKRLPKVLADKVQIEQVVLNLIHNSLDAMRDMPKGDRQVVIETFLSGVDAVSVAVRDTGPGLPQQLVERVFEPFFSTKPTGLGLGLSICRAIVEAHDGRLWATPGKARGCTFTFSLPIARMKDDESA
jgi:two-component system sensor histidine kinase TtrS